LTVVVVGVFIALGGGKMLRFPTTSRRHFLSSWHKTCPYGQPYLCCCPTLPQTRVLRSLFWFDKN